MLIVFTALLAVYAVTAPATVVLEDDGEFVMAAYYMGVAHPPGYPLFVLLAHPFTWLPFGSVAYRVHLASGFFAAGGCAVLWWVVRTLASKNSTAYVASLCLGVSRTFWSQAIIAEVYSLNVLIFVSCLALSLAYVESREPSRLGALAFVFGLGLSNHWPLIILASPCILLVLLPVARSIVAQFPRVLAWGLPLGLLGLTPYIWMAIRSQSSPELTFSGAIESWDDLVFYVSRGPYSDSDVTAGLTDKLQMAGFLLKETALQFTVLGAFLAVIGATSKRVSWISLGLWAGFLTTPIGLLLLRDVEFGLASRAITKVYPLVPYCIVAIWLALGLDRVMELLRLKAGWPRRAAVFGLALLTVGVAFFSNLRHNNRRAFDFARDYAATLLSSFEPEAIVFMQHDFHTFPMQYLHHVEGLRTDLRLLHSLGVSFALDGRLFNERVRPSARLEGTQAMTRVLALVESTDRPVYFVQNVPQSVSDFDYGFYKKVDKSTEGQTSWIIDGALLAFFRRLLEVDSKGDEVTTWAKDFLIRQMAPVLTAIVEVPPVSPDLVARYGQDLEAASRTLPGPLARLEVLERRGGASAEKRLELALHAEDLQGDAVVALPSP